MAGELIMNCKDREESVKAIAEKLKDYCDALGVNLNLKCGPWFNKTSTWDVDVLSEGTSHNIDNANLALKELVNIVACSKLLK